MGTQPVWWGPGVGDVAHTPAALYPEAAGHLQHWGSSSQTVTDPLHSGHLSPILLTEWVSKGSLSLAGPPLNPISTPVSDALSGRECGGDGDGGKAPPP